MKNDFKATIGIECHVQLKTKSKLFSASCNDAREAAANTLINHIDFGLPGALPVLNKEAITLATKAALALDTVPQLFSTFDRKHYFYPDLPMGYQITQYDQPIIIGGKVNFKVNGKNITVRITRAHLEADAGKSTHPAGTDYSLVDLNRAGTPLLEIVSEPDMHSAAEAKAYAKELYLLMRYSGVTDGDLYHGNMRFDVNVSVSKTDELGTRTETKNLNSFRSIEKAVEFEIKRQIELINGGGTVVQETRGWDEAKQKSISQRSKENADDYRYMPDPDLPPVVLTQRYIEKITANAAELPDVWRFRLTKIGLNEPQIEILIEANLDYGLAGYLDLILVFSQKNLDATQLANWLVNIDLPFTRENKNSESHSRLNLYSQLSQLIKQNQLSSTNAKELIELYLASNKKIEDIFELAQKHNLIQQSDSGVIEAIVAEVIDQNPQAVKDVKSGEEKAIGFLIGQVMQKSKGQANPNLTRELIIKRLK